MRREFAILVVSDVTGYEATRACVRIDGDPVPGGVVNVWAAVPNTPTDNIPDAWDKWQGPKSYTVGDDGFVRVQIKKTLGSVDLRAKIVTVGNTEYFCGDGRGTWLLFNHKFTVSKSKRTFFDEGYRPEIPDAQAPATPAAAVRYTPKLLWRTDPERKVSAVGIDPRGRIVEIKYNDVSRQDAWLVIDGRVVADMKWETGGIFFTEDGRTWLTSEKGLADDGVGGRITNCCELVGDTLRELRFKTHYCGCGLSVAGQPHFLDAEKGGPPLVKDVNGRVVKTLAGQGIPYDAVEFPSGGYVTSICDGDSNGLSWSDGFHLKCDARGLTVRGRAVYAGIAGSVSKVNYDGTVTPTSLPKLGDSVDSMYTDPAGNTFISVSNPDALYVWRSSSVLEKIVSIPDASDGGSLFRSEVTGRGARVIWQRNSKKDGDRSETYDVIPVTGGVTAVPDTQGTDILSGATWLAHRSMGDLSKAKIVCTLKIASWTERVCRFITSRPLGDGDTWLCMFSFRDGRWIGGPIDGCDGDGDAVKAISNFTSADKGGPLTGRYGPGKDEAANRVYLRAKAGELVACCLVNPKTASRSEGQTAVHKNTTYGSVPAAVK